MKVMLDRHLTTETVRLGQRTRVKRIDRAMVFSMQKNCQRLPDGLAALVHRRFKNVVLQLLRQPAPMLRQGSAQRLADLIDYFWRETCGLGRGRFSR